MAVRKRKTTRKKKAAPKRKARPLSAATQKTLRAKQRKLDSLMGSSQKYIVEVKERFFLLALGQA